MGSPKGQKRDGRSTDIKFRWLTKTMGIEYKWWQELASQWMEKQEVSISDKLSALSWFFTIYIPNCAPYASSDILSFFSGRNGHISSADEMQRYLKENGVIDSNEITRRINICCDFIDSVILHNFSELDDYNNICPVVNNPLSKLRYPNQRTETVRIPLPYRYIKELRQIICPVPKSPESKQSAIQKETHLPPYKQCHFRDWKWAQENTGNGDWFNVDPKMIDKNDPDCVWRIKTEDAEDNYQLWSPVKSMVIFIKLHLPLRTYQVRMLDSGESDTWRYQYGAWVINDLHDFAIGTPKRPFHKGVFNRIYDSMNGIYSTGLYINTNKTADKNKNELDRGYSIPWQHEEVLYWLEKLRNWQEKYNPINEQVSCVELERKHTKHTKSAGQLQQMGEFCFLMRNASAKNSIDKTKPVTDESLALFWYQLLFHLENKLYQSGDRLSNGEPLKLVTTDKSLKKSVSTLFPLHSLRVSLITAYCLNTTLPLPVISKLLAGHSRLLMTIYYTKLTPSVMAQKMSEAETELDETSEQSIRCFIKDASMSQIKCKMVYHNEDSIEAALANRNPIGWEARACGLCLVGGNTVRSDELSTIGGCWNGGPVVRASRDAKSRIYGSVPHGPENCIRCRWFITEARYLPALNAKFNQLGYLAHQAANLAAEIEGELDALKDQQFIAEEKNLIFTKKSELQILQRRYEKQLVEADEYAKDWISCFELMNRIIQIELARKASDDSEKIIAIGDENDISQCVKLIETNSELLHLSLLCDDAEFYPDLLDELRKTPVIEKRTRMLSRILMRAGFEPLFMEMDDKQQLIAGNAMLRHMSKIADHDDKLEGYRKAASYLEAEEYLIEMKLLDCGISAITKSNTPLKLSTRF